MSAHVPILTYHSIDEDPAPTSTSPALFAKHVESLRRDGWRTARVGDIGRALRERRELPDRTLAFTFDDGYENFATGAWPLLREAGFGATLFVVTERLGARADWAGVAGAASKVPLLSAADVRRLAAEGVEIGCHSATHPALASLEPARLADETAGACATLSALVGGPVETFAYPYGAYDRAARAAVARACGAACSTRLGFAGPRSDSHLLERIDAYYLRDPSLVERLGAPIARLALGLRRIPRRLRNRYG